MAGAAPHGPDWARFRRGFRLDPAWVHLGTSQYLASHPPAVAAAIARHRDALDRNPVLAAEDNDRRSDAVRRAAARYFEAGAPHEVALTGSTTMGLGLLYNGLPLREGDDVLTTEHEHYAQWEALRDATRRAGATLRKVRLHDGSAAACTRGELVERVVGAVTRRTRAVALTWVQSDTGLRLPVADVARALRNGWRDPPLLCVDGTHGVGACAEPVGSLGADFVAGDFHKWMLGPRGTGFVWGREEAWERIRPAVAGFTDRMDAFAHDEERPEPMSGRRFTPGGFHAFEHRWAVLEAIRLHERLGREAVAERIAALNGRCKRGLAGVPGVELRTPMSPALSAGIVAFEVAGLPSSRAKDRLRRRKVIATVAPYPTAFLRFTPGLINDERDVDAGVAAVAALRGRHRRATRPTRRRPVARGPRASRGGRLARQVTA